MLVLNRRPNERIIIGDNIIITVVDIRGRYVRIGIEAPPDIRVDREEVHERLKQEARANEPF
jgi:carbon storage regulator